MVGIVTVVYNQKSYLEDLYNSLVSQTYKNFILYFVDNNSKDGSLDYFKKLNSNNLLNVKYIVPLKNTGFACGSNFGAQHAIEDGCKYLFILNNDVVLERNCIEVLFNLMESDESIACSGPLLMMDNKKNPDIIQEFGGRINYKNGLVEKYFTNKKINEVKLPEIMDTEFISGGTFFVRENVFKQVGMFEESYFAYFDEIDILYRIKSLNKYKLLVTSKAIVWHNHKWTKKNKNGYYFEYYLSERNKFLYYYKFKLYLSILYSLIVDSIKFPWRLSWFIKVCDFRLGLYYLKGMLDGLLNRKGKPRLKFFEKL